MIKTQKSQITERRIYRGGKINRSHKIFGLSYVCIETFTLEFELAVYAKQFLSSYLLLKKNLKVEFALI